MNGNPQPNLQNEIEGDFQFLRTATTEQVKQKIYANNEIERFNTTQRVYEAQTANVSRVESLRSNQNYQENDYQRVEQQEKLHLPGKERRGTRIFLHD